MSYSDEQLQKALVDALPDVLGEFMGGAGFYWQAEGPFVTPRSITENEWPVVVNKVFCAWLKKNNKTPAHYAYFSPAASWQEIAEYLVSAKIIRVRR